MKTKDILAITTVALGTAALTVTTFWSGPIDAGVEIEGAAIKINQPKLVCRDIELSVTHPGAQAIKAGEQPAFELAAFNTSKADKTAKVCVMLTCTAPTSPLSRTIAMPTTLWKQEEVLTLKAGETRLVPLTVTTSLPANSLFSIQLADMDSNTVAETGVPKEIKPITFPSPNQIVAYNFSTITENPSSLQVAAGGKSDKKIIVTIP